MALYSDGYISSLSDLRDQETGLLDATHAEGVDLTTKLRLAQEEIGIEVVAFLLEHGRGVSGDESLRQLRQVVVTPALKQWHTFHTLELAYRDLYFNQYNDRYAEKWKEYGRLAKGAASILFETGVGIANDPLARAATPTLGWTSGTMAAGTYYVRMSWVNTSGVEGAASETAAVVTAEGSQLLVTPQGAPPTAAGWNVYVGTAADEVGLQNDAPLAPAGSWTIPTTGLKAGRAPSDGQSPDQYVTVTRVVRRG